MHTKVVCPTCGSEKIDSWEESREENLEVEDINLIYSCNDCGYSSSETSDYWIEFENDII